MALRNLSGNDLGLRRLSSNYLYQSDFGIPTSTYEPNPLWPVPTEPNANGSEDKFVGLYAVYFERAIDGTGGIASVDVSTSSGTYTVNWGDGTSDSAVSSGSVTTHEYDVDNTSLYDASVTFTDTGDLVTRNGHHYTNGDRVRFYNIQSTTGLTVGTTYYVINTTTNTFQISATSGGSAVALTTDGTGSLLPYKVATVTITPDTGSITAIDPSDVNNIGLNGNYYYDWLDCIFSHPSCTDFRFGKKSGTLERIKVIASGTVTRQPEELFELNEKLRWVECPEDMYSSQSDFSYTFNGCISLQVAPYLNTSSGTNFRNMFNGCSSLVSIPVYDTSSGTNFREMFSGCRSLLSVPLLDTSSGTDLYRMFYNSSTLKVVQGVDTLSATTVLGMFENCFALETVQSEFDLSSCTNASDMFRSAYALRGSVTLKNCSNITTLESLFNSAYSIGRVTIEGISTSLTSLRRTFAYASSLQEVVFTNCNTSSNTTCHEMFRQCYTLRIAPDMDTSSVTTMYYMHNGNENLEEVPSYNTVSVTDMQYMFDGCETLKTIPAFDLTAGPNLTRFVSNTLLDALPYMDTSAVTDFQSMLDNCQQLKVLPAYDMSSAANSSSTQMWNNNYSMTRIKTTGMKYSFDISETELNSAELDEVYTNCATVTGQTITVTGCRGTDGDDPTIATAKGWTVTG